MNSNDYLVLLKSRIEAYFDIKDISMPSIKFDLVGEFNSTESKYFFVPSINLYSIAHDEYLFAACFEKEISVATFTDYCNFMKTEMNKLTPKKDHMNSNFVLVLICNHLQKKDLITLIQQTKYHKDYAFTLKGWSDLGLILVDLEQKQIYTNKFAEKMRNNFDFFTN